MEKITVEQVIIVEGKYDKIKLKSLVNAIIITTDGFRIYKDKEKIALIKALGAKHGIILLTDSDVAGFKLRNFIRSISKDIKIYNLYIPQITGKEKRKEKASKEGYLGVEGINADTLRGLFNNLNLSTTITDASKVESIQITKMDFYDDGLSGGENSANKRLLLLAHLGLPNYITTNSLLEVINSFMSYEEYKSFITQQGE